MHIEHMIGHFLHGKDIVRLHHGAVPQRYINGYNRLCAPLLYEGCHIVMYGVVIVLAQGHGAHDDPVEPVKVYQLVDVLLAYERLFVKMTGLHLHCKHQYIISVPGTVAAYPVEHLLLIACLGICHDNTYTLAPLHTIYHTFADIKH